MERIERIIDFWFGPAGSDQRGIFQQRWFEVSPEFDAAIREQFLADAETAAAGGFAEWRDSPPGCLALVLLLDQFPRNLFRGTPRAFAADPLARAVAGQALERGFDAALSPVERIFLYLPFEHSEDIADQERSVALFRALGDEQTLDYAIRHRDIVARFGRFPHRNAILGRTSTAEEEAFLKEPGSSF